MSSRPRQILVAAVTATMLAVPLGATSTAAAAGSAQLAELDVPGVAVAWGQTSVPVGSTSVVTGTVTPAEAGRPVVVERTAEGSSSEVARTTTDGDGAFRVAIEHDVAGDFAYRVRAAATETDPTERVSAPATIVVTAPVTRTLTAALSARRVAAGESVTLSGTLPRSASGWTLTLQRQAPGGWFAAAPKRNVDRSEYRFTLPTTWYGSHRFRVVAEHSGARVVSPARVVKVRPTYRPSGRARDHSFFGGPAPRWNPCTPLRYRVNTRQATAGALADVKGAMSRIREATGLDFVYAGPTSVIPQGTSGERFPGDTDFVIAWARPGQAKMLASNPSAAGVGGPEYYSFGFRNGDGRATSWIVRGKVVLNATQRYPAGFGAGYTRGELLMHEIAHATGLDHTMSRAQMMYPVMQPGLARFGAGDLAGLAKVGAGQGCIYSAQDDQPITARYTAVPTSVFRTAVLGSDIE
jgi:hypothetical protein